jgi:hypothetical protein
MPKDLALAATCGLYCGNCEFLGEQCAGCGNVQGKPFWTKQANMDVCPLYECCTELKKVEHCGLCDEFPCGTFTSLRDPSYTDAEYEKAIHDRIITLRARKKMGTEAWLKKEP